MTRNSCATTVVVMALGCGVMPAWAADPASAPASEPVTEVISKKMVTNASPADVQPGTATTPHPELMPRSTVAAGVALKVDNLSPTVASPGKDITVQVNVKALTADRLDTTVRVRAGGALLSRAELDADRDVATLPVVSADTPVTARKDGTQVTVKIPAARLSFPASYGVLPLVVEASRQGQTSTLATFLPFERTKEYEPISLAVAIPLTADPDPEMVSPDPGTRERAWERAVKDGSRIDRILKGTNDADVTYAVDPALTGALPKDPGKDNSKNGTEAPPSGAATSSTSSPNGSSPSPSPSPGSPAGSGPRAGLAERLSSLATTHPLWELPSGDPDLAALLGSGVSKEHLASVLRSDRRLADRVSPDSTPVAWPTSSLTQQQFGELKSGYGPDRPASLLLPSGATAPGSAAGPAGPAAPAAAADAARRLSDGTAVLAYDETLSKLLANSSAPDRVGLVQRFLAETMTLLQQSPGKARRLLAVAPRSLNPQPSTLNSMLSIARSTPWLRSISTGSLLTTARSPEATVTQLPTGQVPSGAIDAGGSPLDPSRLGAMEHDVDRLQGFSSALAGPTSTTAPAAQPTANTRPVDPSAVSQDLWSLLSVRWRGRAGQWEEARRLLDGRVSSLIEGVSVIPSQVNFFADSGMIQVTVVNKLSIDVHDLQLRLVPPGRSPRLRVPESAQPVSVAAGSRATVRIPAESVAAGTVVIATELTTPDGTRLGVPDTTLSVHVQPTNGWLILGLGGATGVIFLVGLLRTIRHNRPRVSAEDLKEIDLE
ncbi:DUF6049 family protein [Austwickia sp. TVS 96-490-7B]|uniref:DUF6049 family protein n=1 Tax=Austwickia sp. TVS 96-490-7B TaxID=2830843 RepID=UPI001C55C11B|nr:DUF6049 family protein [Austwickia sp. TVS 96-490-7B]